VSSIIILGVCHIAQKKGKICAFHMHLSSSNSVEFFFVVLVTVNIESDSVSSIIILEACHTAQKKGEEGAFHIHLSPSNSVELFTIMLVNVYNKI